LIASPTSEEILPREGRLAEPETGGGRVVEGLVGEPTLTVEELLLGCSCSTTWEAGLVGVEGGEAYDVRLSTVELDPVVDEFETDVRFRSATGD